MTVNSSNTYEFSILQIVKAAYRYALLTGPGAELTPPQETEGLDAFERTMRDLDKEGVRLRQTRFDDLTLTADSPWVELGADVIDVGPYAMYIAADESDPTQADSETRATRVDGTSLHIIGTHSNTGPTTKFRLDKEQLPFRLELWPIPDETGTLRVESQVLAANSRTGANTPDVDRHWTETLVNGIAWKLAKSGGASLDRVLMLKADFEQGKLECKGKSNDAVAQTFKYQHRTQWSGYR